MVLATFTTSDGKIICRREFKDESDWSVYDDIESIRNSLSIKHDDNVQVKTDVITKELNPVVPTVSRF